MNTPHAGYAQEIITPTLGKPVFLAGFGNNRRAETIHDDLTCRALALRSGDSTLVLCALDLIGFFRSDVQEVLRNIPNSAVPNASIIIASTHTHHGPDTMGLWGPDDKTSGVDPAYIMELRQKVAKTIRAAVENLQPCGGIRAATVHVPGVAKNARNPEIVDDELTVLQFSDPDSRTLVSFFNFPCHPEVLWEHNPHITADYPGYLRSEVEEQTGAPCIFFSGALGGMMTPDVQDHSFEEAEWMGKKLANEGLKAINSVISEPLSEIRVQKKELAAKLTNPLYKIAFWRKLLPDVRDRSGKIHSEVNLIQVGPAWLATVPGELLPKLGLAIKASLTEAGGRAVGIIGLANDELGYILPPEDFKYPWNPFNPGKHYEETNSIGKEIGPKVMEALRSLL